MLAEALASLRGPYLAPALALSLVAYLIASYAVSWYRLRKFTGPRLASFSYLWMLRVCRAGTQAASYEHTNDKYGHVARIGPNDLITDDPDLIRWMNGARSTYRRSNWYSAMRMDPHDDTLFSVIDNAKHDQLRAKLSFGYGGKENPHLERDIDEQLAGFVAHIRRYISDRGSVTRPYDLAVATQYFTMDAITKIAYGKEFGYLETNSDVFHVIRTIEETLPYAVMNAEMPFLGWVFSRPWVVKLLAPKKTDPSGLGRMLGVAADVVASRLGPDAKDRNDMLGAFLRHGVTPRECELEIPLQLVAGSDTTAAAIRGTMLHLGVARHAYLTLQKEIDTAAAEGRISSPITGDEAKKLEYLQAVVYEGLRIQTPFTALAMKEVPPGGDTLPDGRFVPGGTRIAQNWLAIQRRRDIYGDDADVFRPERWLGISAEQKQLMVQTTELVFGYGRWGCLGKPLAFLELNKVFVELLRRFDFEILYPKRPWRETNMNIYLHREMWVRVTERFPDAIY